MTARIEEVAERAGVAVSTVSRALRDVPGVSLATRQRIKDIAAEVGYLASPNAARLATGVTGTVAVVVPDAAKWFFGQVISGAGAVLRASGRDVLLYELGDAEGRRRFFEGKTLRGRADAVLVLSLRLSTEETQSLRTLGLPVVLLGQGSEVFGSVRVDDRAAARSAVRHLLNLGHRRIGLIGIDDADEVTTGSTPPLSRLAGYRQSLLAAGIPLEEDLEQFGTNSVSGGELAMTRLLSAPALPTAVFVGSDEMAFGALGVLRTAGMTVPRDISVIGFDNHDLSQVMDLTTIDQNIRGQGEAAAELLLETLSTALGTAPPDRIIDTRLVLRRSTAPPADIPTSSKKEET
ncbi:LacI family DNA-binding transcriptional regulator [Arthrobacter sp. ISL-65]|uniref:LacI family DNA-binding transcriptional regulator n=1 Tax=Arthrobacter sp. ISL-65 TaxID=2819112 RepID=UPI001BE7A1A2|nr:LacI family DNA-binding transcriptional regulator [Arthrobacter sp. ISL-65]MBT2547208.1 LacI family DNA-binding transcriptional regulator [Arthrobacter sp. ISL-65]